MKNYIRRVEKHYDSKSYRHYVSQQKLPMWKLVNRLKWGFIQEFLPESKNALILDAGGGWGKWTVPLARKYNKVILNDISQEALNIARNRLKKEGLLDRVAIKKEDIRKLAYPAKYFDFILCEGDTVSITPEPKKAVKELARVMKVDGVLCAALSNYYCSLFYVMQKEGLKACEKFLKTKSVIEEGIEFKSFKPEEIRNVFRRYGLKILKLVTIDFKHYLLPMLAGGRYDDRSLSNAQFFRRFINLERRLSQSPVTSYLGGNIQVAAKKL